MPEEAPEPTPLPGLDAPQLPLRSSWMAKPLGAGAGIFQFGTAKLRDDMDVETLVGVVASSRGAPLGSCEFDTFSVILQRFCGQPDDRGWVTIPSTYELTRSIYNAHSSERYDTVLTALDRLSDVWVSLPGYDAETGTWKANAITKRRLITEVVVTVDDAELPRNAGASLRSLVSQAGGKGALKLRLADWLVEYAQTRNGRELDFDVQRSLRGVAKRLWIELESAAFQPAGDNVEAYTLTLDDDTLRRLGLECARRGDNITQLRNRLRTIVAADPSYIEVEELREDRDRRRVTAMVVYRATGAQRQKLLRAQLLSRHAEEVSQAS